MELNQVTLPALDMAASVKFYRTMGFEALVVSGPYARFKAPVGNSTFSLHAIGTPGPTSSEPPAEWSKIVVYFECAELDKQVAALKARGIQFMQEPRDEPWAWREARLLDPAGNVICLYHDNAGNSRLYPPWRGSA